MHKNREAASRQPGPRDVVGNWPSLGGAKFLGHLLRVAVARPACGGVGLGSRCAVRAAPASFNTHLVNLDPDPIVRLQEQQQDC